MLKVCIYNAWLALTGRISPTMVAYPEMKALTNYSERYMEELSREPLDNLNTDRRVASDRIGAEQINRMLNDPLLKPKSNSNDTD